MASQAKGAGEDWRSCKEERCFHSRACGWGFFFLATARAKTPIPLTAPTFLCPPLTNFEAQEAQVAAIVSTHEKQVSCKAGPQSASER